MPQPVTFHVKPLLQICLGRLLYHLVKNCSSERPVASDAYQVENEGNKSVSVKSDVAANPFAECPSTLLDQILETMKYVLKNGHFDLLLNTRLRKLMLCRFTFNNERDICRALQLATVRCPELSVLGMKHFYEFPSTKTYQELLPRFKHLQVLDASFSSTFDDSCLEILGIHCQDLRVLNINHSYKITDVGIKGLCGGTTELGMKEMQIGQSGQCKSLRQLSITGTKITFKGVQMILMHSPHLNYLEDQSVIQALADMHRPEADNLVIRPKSYALIQMSLFEHGQPTLHVPYKTGDLRLVAPLCPLVTDLNIGVQVGVTDADLLSLMVLETLSKLRVSYSSHGSNRCSITFDGGLAPLLKVRGRSLTSLELVNLPISIHLAIIVEYCPNLKLLALERCTYWAPAKIRPIKRTKTELVLNHLEQLTIKGNFVFFQALNLFMPTEGFFVSLTAPSLKRLSILCCDNLNDDIIQEIFQFHPFTSLEKLTLYDCRFVTRKGIDLFMNEENNLKNVIICSCELVTNEDFAGWRKKVKENNWDTWVVRM